MSSTPVRVRIAPSPSGYLHVGTARTAIANLLFARHYEGAFVIRIEDTDKERSKAELIEPITDALKWLGIESDESLVYQSQRLNQYGQYAGKILDAGHAYRCFMTAEEIEAERKLARQEKRNPDYRTPSLSLSEDEIHERVAANVPHTIRLKIPNGETTFDDMVSGHLKKANVDLEDLVLARSDGTATYNLAVVVDDHEMGISHVIRGNDHITNTFKQVLIYRALEWEPPVFGHLPLILRPDKKKVSKRLGDKDVNEYQKEGILPEAMFNYLCLLGWSPKEDREVFTVPELIERFTEKNFNASNAVFDEEKLLAINKAHIMLKSDHELATLVAPLLVEADLTTKYWLETRWEYLRHVVGLLKERVTRLDDFPAQSGFFFQFDYTYDEKAAGKHFTPEAAEYLKKLYERFASLSRFDAESLEKTLSDLADELGVKRAKLIHPTRLAVSGVPVGPSLYHMLQVLDQRVVLERLEKAIEHIQKQNS
ncbi:glutamate--tRNA ligase [candidate division GN15 bacterium]|nr:glutamate--tRNA ligase [candidate division GN15 bacterium]